MICESLHFDQQKSSDLLQLNFKKFLCYYREFKDYLVKFVLLNIMITNTFNVSYLLKINWEIIYLSFTFIIKSLSILHNSVCLTEFISELYGQKIVIIPKLYFINFIVNSILLKPTWHLFEYWIKKLISCGFTTWIFFVNVL